jgi:hypothetical protein
VSSYWILFYDYVEDYLERRTPLRPSHFAVANEAVESGALVLAGAFAEPADGAALVFRADDVSTVEQFVARDPYVREGLVASWRIRPWTVVAGTSFASPSPAPEGRAEAT